MRRIAMMILAIALAAMAAACGGTTATSGVEGTKAVSATTPADQASLCDWFAGLVGGYNTTPTCSMALLSAPPSQAECLADFPTCAVPVATFETCIRKVVAAQQTCTTQSMTEAQTTPECATVGQAGCFN